MCLFAGLARVLGFGSFPFPESSWWNPFTRTGKGTANLELHPCLFGWGCFLSESRLFVGWQWQRCMVDTFEKRIGLDLNISDLCVICHKEELTNHLFLHCQIVGIHFGVTSSARCGLTWCFPIANAAVLVGGTFIRYGYILWRIIPFAIVVYLERKKW